MRNKPNPCRVYIGPDDERYPRNPDRAPTWALTAALLVALGVGCFFALGAVPYVEPLLKEALR